MRLYPAEQLETMRTLRLLKDWQDEGLLTGEQGQQLQEQTVSNLRTTNLFLRVVLFLFTVAILVLLLALFAVTMGSAERWLVVPLLFLSAICYASAEYAVREVHLYHHGIEEALVVCSIVFLLAGLQLNHQHFTTGSDPAELFIVMLCACVSLWTWYRFGYWYTFVAAMLFAAFAPGCVIASPAAQHTLVAVLYAAGLIALGNKESRQRFEHLQTPYSVAEAFLWTGLYLSMNLVLSVLNPHWLRGLVPTKSAFPWPFYWFTWFLIWCLPPVVLLRGIRRKNRILISLGAGLAILTFISNKPYLGWQRHTWDPMLLGIVLIGVAWYLQRWLATGAGGVRNGFTAARLAGKQNAWMTTGPAALSLLLPNPISHNPQPATPGQPLGAGGASGGAGAGADF